MSESKPKFWNPVPVIDLVRTTAEGDWIWKGAIAKGRVTLLASEYKAGKTTLISALLKQMGKDGGGTLCGMEVSAGHAAVVSEEPGDFWIERNERLQFGPNVEVIDTTQQWLGKPTWADWAQFLNEALAELRNNAGFYDLIVLDTLSHLWPVERENDNAEVAKALMPLRALANQGVAVLAVHHFGAGTERIRGATEIGALFDTLLTLHIHNAEDLRDRRRRLKIKGRLSLEPTSLVVELNDAGDDYTVVEGDPPRTAPTTWDILETLVPPAPPGWSAQEFCAVWPSDRLAPTEKKLLEKLHDKWHAAGWTRTGTGKKGSPYRYYKQAELIPPSPFPP
jgi:hypothetical protein